MATNGKPTTSFTINYGTLTPAAAERALAPVLIAPRYKLHGFEEGYADAYLGKFDADNNKLVDVEWPAKTDGGILDIVGSCLYAKSAKILINEMALTGTVSSSATNVLVMDCTVKNVNDTNKVPEELGDIEVKVGDLVKIAGTNGYEYANIVDIKPTYDATNINAIANTNNTGTYLASNIDTNDIFNSEDSATYMLKIREDGTDSEVTVELSALGGDSGYSETLIFKNNSLNVGTKGLTVALNGDKQSLKRGDVFFITCQPKGVKAYNRIYVDKALAPTTGSAKHNVFFATDNLTSGYSVVSGSGWVASNSAITVNDEIRIKLNGVNYRVQEAEMYVAYRELLTDRALFVVASTEDNVSEYVGVAHPDNPMGMLYACCSQVPDAFFYMCSIDNTADADYIKAVNYVSKYERIYAPITYKQNAAIQSAIISAINKYSSKTIAQYKNSWFVPTIDREVVVYEKDSSGNAILGTIDNGVLTVSAPADLVGKGIKSGDKVNIILDFDVTTNKYETATYEINVVESSTTATLKNATNVSLSQIYITRGLSAEDYANELAAEAARINNHRIQLVVSDQLNWGDFKNVDKVYAAATLATYRCALPPHAPMNELILPGFTVTDTLRWSDLNYETMNNGGCWVLYNDLNNNAVVYHQITTKTDGTIAEENSAVANGDAIVRRLRQSVKNLASGKANVTNSLLGLIKAQLTAEIEYIMSIPYSDTYGPQILDYKITQISQVPGNKKSIMCALNLELPLPLQNGDFYFNLF